MTAPLLLLPCPECAVLKCGNCDGRTWDVQADEHAPCPCAGAGHDQIPAPAAPLQRQPG